MRSLVGLDLAVTADNRACMSDETGPVLAERRFPTREATSRRFADR